MGCPQPLQVGRYPLGARRADEQVATVLEVERLQVVVVQLLTQQAVGRHV